MPPTSRTSRAKREDYYRDRRRRKVCAFCADKSSRIDYKEVNRLRRYLSERAKIEPRRKTGTCAEHQRAPCLRPCDASCHPGRPRAAGSHRSSIVAPRRCVERDALDRASWGRAPRDH